MKFTLIALLTLSLVAPVCAIDKPAGEGEALWKPEVGDTWVYDVTVEVAKGTELPSKIAGQKIEQIDGKLRATYKQTSVYHGVKPMNEEGAEADAFYVSNGDQLEQIEYMKISEQAVDAVGSKREGVNPGDVIILGKPIPLVRSDWKGGEGFPFTMDRVVDQKKLHFTRQFRVLGWEILETGAGEFKVLHVQITGMNGPMEIKRNYWFSPNSGFIKEAKKYYIADKVIFSETKVLAKMEKKKS